MYRLLMENADVDCVAACQVDRKEGFVLKLFKRAFYHTFNGMADDISIPASVSDFRVFRRPCAMRCSRCPSANASARACSPGSASTRLRFPTRPSNARRNQQMVVQEAVPLRCHGHLRVHHLAAQDRGMAGQHLRRRGGDIPAVSAGRVPAVRDERPGLPPRWHA